MIQIKNAAGLVIAEGETFHDALKESNYCLAGAVLKDLDLSGSNFKGVDFSRANITDVSFSSCNLDGAVFNGATLASVNFTRSFALGASFRRATLLSCDFSHANLSDSTILTANETKNITVSRLTTLPNGLSYEDFLQVVVELLLAGGRAWKDVSAEHVWDCHSWSNCPMHVAFCARTISDIPLRWRSYAAEFIGLFDKRILTREDVLERYEELGDYAKSVFANENSKELGQRIISIVKSGWDVEINGFLEGEAPEYQVTKRPRDSEMDSVQGEPRFTVTEAIKTL